MFTGKLRNFGQNCKQCAYIVWLMWNSENSEFTGKIPIYVGNITYNLLFKMESYNRWSKGLHALNVIHEQCKKKSHLGGVFRLTVLERKIHYPELHFLRIILESVPKSSIRISLEIYRKNIFELLHVWVL